MKRYLVLVTLITVGIILPLGGCEQDYYRSRETRTETRITAYAADGLDLKAVGELLKTAKDAKEFESQLNKPGGINNLDLDEDDRVDFIKVTSEDQKGIRVMKLTAVLSSTGDLQDVATIEVEKSENTANVQIHGNEQIYGPHYYYHSHFGLTDALLLYWLFSPRYTPYYSPWGWGSYPRYYGRGYTTVPVSTYRSRTRDLTRGSPFASSSSSRLSKPITPSTVHTSDRVRAPLKNPTSSQRAFQARNPSKHVSRGGFGRASRLSRSTRSSRFGRSRSMRFGK